MLRLGVATGLRRNTDASPNAAGAAGRLHEVLSQDPSLG